MNTSDSISSIQNYFQFSVIVVKSLACVLEHLKSLACVLEHLKSHSCVIEQRKSLTCVFEQLVI